MARISRSSRGGDSGVELAVEGLDDHPGEHPLADQAEVAVVGEEQAVEVVPGRPSADLAAGDRDEIRREPGRDLGDPGEVEDGDPAVSTGQGADPGVERGDLGRDPVGRGAVDPGFADRAPELGQVADVGHGGHQDLQLRARREERLHDRSEVRRGAIGQADRRGLGIRAEEGLDEVVAAEEDDREPDLAPPRLLGQAEMLAGGDGVGRRGGGPGPVVGEPGVPRLASRLRGERAEVQPPPLGQDLDPVPGRGPMGRVELVLVGVAVADHPDTAGASRPRLRGESPERSQRHDQRQTKGVHRRNPTDPRCRRTRRDRPRREDSPGERHGPIRTSHQNSVRRPPVWRVAGVRNSRSNSRRCPQNPHGPQDRTDPRRHGFPGTRPLDRNGRAD